MNRDILHAILGIKIPFRNEGLFLPLPLPYNVATFGVCLATVMKLR